MTHFSDFGDPAWLTASDILWGNHGSFSGQGNQDITHQIREIIIAFEGIGYVAGGAARYLLVPEAPEPADIDVFLYQDYMDTSPLDNLEYTSDNPEIRAPFFTSPGDGELRVQVVRPDHGARKSFGTPLEVLQSFTFHTEQAAVWYGPGGAAGLISVAGQEATEERVLTNNHIANPVLSLFRLNKYGRKGYSLSMDTLVEITDVLHEYSEERYQAALADARSMESTPPEVVSGEITGGWNIDLPF